MRQCLVIMSDRDCVGPIKQSTLLGIIHVFVASCISNDNTPFVIGWQIASLITGKCHRLRCLLFTLDMNSPLLAVDVLSYIILYIDIIYGDLRLSTHWLKHKHVVASIVFISIHIYTTDWIICVTCPFV